MVVISLNSQRLLICNVLHIPALWVPLYSLCAHTCQPGCRFIGSYDIGFHVYFPRVVLSVDTSTDCHLSYTPLGKSVPLSTLHYVQPCCAPTTYLTEQSALCARTGSAAPPSSLLLELTAIIQDDSSTSSPLALPSFIPAPVMLGFDSPENHPTFYSPILKHAPQPWTMSTLASEHPPSRLLLSLTHNEVIQLVHCPGLLPPQVQPFDQANGLDSKINWALEELHWALGCRHFWNYKHILQTSLNGQ
jgi:hypothetical protein